jgi:hypothetical protein
MNWKRLGKIFDLDELKGENYISHTQVPTPIVMGDFIRVFYSSRDGNGRSNVLYFDFDIENNLLLNSIEESVIDKSKPGTFDEDGIMPGFIIKYNDRFLLYYSGWNEKVSTPYHNSTGLAVSDDCSTFVRLFDGPVLDRIATEPFLAVTPTILIENDIWKMWYISGLGWEMVDDRFEPVYTIKYAESLDGVNWVRPSQIIIPHTSKDEVFSHPSVIKIGGVYHMWFCYRKIYDYRDGNNAYQIGYAYSKDSKNWIRDDEKCGLISNSISEWESKMVCYPSVFEYKSSVYMVYNGNYFGKGGIGLAILEKY